jgi:tRNA (guanine37-N1)-methyltransferase
MLTLKVPPKKAEAARKLLRDKGLSLYGYSHFSRDGFFYLPLREKPSREDIASLDGEVLESEFEKLKPRNLEEALREAGWSEADASIAPRAFDLVGDIAILEVNKGLSGREREIAAALMSVNSHIKVVAKKAGPVSGELRLRELKVIGGESRTVTTHHEAGCAFKVDVAKAWFSPRFVFERQRIASLVKPGEKILALFAGVGPYPVVIAKKQPASEIVAVELNHEACEHMRENLRLNRVTNVKVMEGDVREVAPKNYANWADRIIMPLPLGAGDFLDVALKAAKQGCVIHFYGTGKIEDPFGESLKAIEAACKREGRKFKVLDERIVLPYAPGISRVAVDFEAD